MKTVQIKTPTTLGQLQVQQATLIKKATTQLTTLATQINELDDSGFLPASIASTGPDLRRELQKQLQQSIHCCVVHPYQHTVGEGEGHHRYLSAPNALKALTKKYQDQRDPQQPQHSQAAIVVLITAPHLTSFYQTLTAFTALMPIPELPQITRRVKALMSLETTKWEIPEAPQMPYWRPLKLAQWPTAKNHLTQLGAAQAAIEAISDHASPKSMLTALVAKKQQHLAQMNQDWQHTTHALQQVVGQYLTGNISQQLSQLSAPGHDQVLTVGLLLTGTTAALAFLKEVLSL
ncbi:hypothetical protein [Zooshikella ganghwensis]|uniref:hypothetical protein n=1 Tax=Zooshikella ganghwensis TaxID=202772 RepID=UPI0004257510|nr:hypothetical protein [Zooshikella ganghwensis]